MLANVIGALMATIPAIAMAGAMESDALNQLFYNPADYSDYQ
jgi:hypothetical protein